MSLKEKYAAVLKLGEELKVKDGDVKEEGGKLVIKGTAEYGIDRDHLWDMIKKQAGWETEIVADIKVEKTDVYGYWVVKSGRQPLEDRQGRLRQRRQVHEDLRGQQGPAQGPQHDQAGAEARPAEQVDRLALPHRGRIATGDRPLPFPASALR